MKNFNQNFKKKLKIQNQVYLVTELATGGELLEAVVSRGAYPEDEARAAFAGLVAGVAYLHSRCASVVFVRWCGRGERVK
jgi:serine/threonine protein kinase